MSAKHEFTNGEANERDGISVQDGDAAMVALEALSTQVYPVEEVPDASATSNSTKPTKKRTKRTGRDGLPLLLDMSKEYWMEEGACVGEDPWIFMPDPETKATAISAKEICATCDVQDECLKYALKSNEQAGVWGGLTTSERRALLKNMPDSTPQ